MTRSPAPVAALCGLVVTWAALAAACWLAPPSGDDWLALLRAQEHGTAGALAAVWREGRSVGDLYQQLAVTVRPVHVLVSPLVVLALLGAATTLVLGRWPDPRRLADAAASVIVCAALWVGCPRLGFMWSQPGPVGHQVLGVAAALWLLVPVRLGGERVAPGLVLGGLVGLGAPPIAAVTLVALAWRRERLRARARVAAIAGVVAGAALVWVAPSRPRLGQARVWLDFLHETAELSMWVGLLLVVALLARRGRRADEPAPPPPSAAELGVIGWLALAGLGAVAGAMVWRPWDQLSMLPATTLLALAAVRGLLLAADRVTLRVVTTLALVLHATVLVVGLGQLRRAAADHEARVRALRAAPGERAVAPPRRPLGGSYFVPGEDLGPAALRARVAVELYGARELVLEPRFAGYQVSGEARP